MRDEPGKGCRIYRLYFNEDDPSDVALRRWIWSLPSRKRGHIIKSILRKQLADWGRRKGRRGTRAVRQASRSAPQRGLAALKTSNPHKADGQIQSMIDRALAFKASAS